VFTNGWKQSFAKLHIPKQSLHNSAAFGLRQKFRRDLPENVTFQHYEFPSLNFMLSVSEYVTSIVSAKSHNSARNKLCLYFRLSHESNSHYFKTITFLTVRAGRCNCIKMSRCNCIGPHASGGLGPWCLSKLFNFARY